LEGAGKEVVGVKQMRKSYALITVVLLAFGVLAAMNGMILPSHPAEGQPSPSEASPPDTFVVDIDPYRFL